jgi:aminoglycoside phosphotransferase (APT) family kinase protein
VSRGTPIPVDVEDADIARAVDDWLAHGQGGASVVRLLRRPWEYATSAPLELITAVTDDGREHDLVLKHLGPRHVTDQVRRAKPSFVVDSRREIEVYRRLLAPLGIGPALVGSRIAPETDTCWLLLEHVRGSRLFEVGAPAAWAATAHWLGAFHCRPDTVDQAAVRHAAGLIECQRDSYRIWIDRALQFFGADGPSRSRHDGKALRWLDERYDRVIDHLLSLPSTLIHGEFYPENVIMTGAPDSWLPCPIDWETASIGPGVLDLAALTAGEWREQDRRDLTTAYLAGSGKRVTLDELSESVQYAHIQLAVRWLGWFGRRDAPDAHARDWLADAIERAEALNL